jgi:hypothetical protein
VRRFAQIGAVAATTAALLPALAAFDHAHAPALSTPAADSADDQPLIIEEISPTAVGEDSTVRVSGRVTNTTDAPIDEVTVRLRYSGTPFGSRSELDAYADGGRDLPAYGPTSTLDDPVAPGASADYTVEVDAEDLGLSSFGVYPLAVEALAPSGEPFGAQYTFLPYEGDDRPDPVDIAWVWPLMDRPQRADDGTYLGDGLSESVGPDGRLGRLLVAGAQDDETTLEQPHPTPEAADEDTPAAEEDTAAPRASGDDADAVPLTWAVDPALLDDISGLTGDPYEVVTDPGAVDDPADAPTETVDASLNAQVWLAQARTALRTEPLIATPYANPDIAALLRADLAGDAEAAVPLGRDLVESVLERPADTDVAWPAGGMMDNATRDFLAGQGASTFLLDDSAMPADEWLGHTAHGAAPLSLPDGEDGTALLADSGLTAVLGQDSTGPGAAALAQQRFAAETAMISAEDPGTDRTVVAVPPADWNPGAEFASGVLAASSDLPWLDPVELADVEPGSAGERQGLTYPDAARDAELGADHLDRVADVRGDVRLFNSILEDEADDPFRPAILRLESAAWREDELAGTAAGLVAHQVAEDTGRVHIIPGEPVTLASKTGTIGVLVANDLEDHAVEVNLSMLSANPERLSVDGHQDTIEIGPGRKTTVYVPLSARINGRTLLHLSLHNAEGEPVSEEQVLSVNATGLGSQALLISGIGAAVLVVALAPRALRKWARRRAAAAGAAPGDGDTGGGTEAEDVPTDPSPAGGADSGTADGPDSPDTPGSADDGADDAPDTGAAGTARDPKGGS